MAKPIGQEWGRRLDGCWKLKFLHLQIKEQDGPSDGSRLGFCECLTTEWTYSVRVPRKQFSAAVDPESAFLIHCYGLHFLPQGWGWKREEPNLLREATLS